MTRVQVFKCGRCGRECFLTFAYHKDDTVTEYPHYFNPEKSCLFFGTSIGSRFRLYTEFDE